MQARALWAATLIGAALADSAGEPQLAVYLAFAAVSIAGVVVLGALGELVEARHGEGREGVAAVRALLAAGGLVLAVVASASRGVLVTEGEVPATASSALGAILVLLALDVLVVAGTAVAPARAPRRRRRRPVREAEPVAEERRAA